MEKKEVLKKTDDEWKETLTAEQYYVLRNKGTERPWSGKYNEYKSDGVYYCAGCKSKLFESHNKFDSGSGWPSFFKSIGSSVTECRDSSYGMLRIEVVCSKCEGHLGHLFPDGPKPSGLRYCINSLSIVHDDDLEK